MDPFTLVVVGGLAALVLVFWLLGRYYPGSGLEQLGLQSARELQEQAREARMHSGEREEPEREFGGLALSRLPHTPATEREATEAGYRSGAISSLDFEAARSAYTQALVTAMTAYYASQQAQATFQLLVGK